MSSEGASYRAAGVDYDVLDAGKRLAMASALATSPLLQARGARAIDGSRGEPAFAFELDGRTLAFVVEGLGTKSMIARAVLEQSGADRFADVAYDTVAAIVNDLCCTGAAPLVVNAYFATGSSDWYADERRAASLVAGWRRGCEDAGCAWGGGESPSLPGLLASDEIELAGAAVGALPPGRGPLLGEQLAPGDQIVLVASNGLHANGASLARLIASRLPEGWATALPSGRTFGEAVLDPSIVYSGLVAALLDRERAGGDRAGGDRAGGDSIHYLSHITGHGLLKLMRPPRELTYRVAALPPVPEVLVFLAEQAGLEPAAAYSTFNMGAGFAVYCSPGSGQQVVELAEGMGLAALVAGEVEEGPRRVLLDPVGVSLGGDRLELSVNPNP